MKVRVFAGAKNYFFILSLFFPQIEFEVIIDDSLD